MNKKLIEIETNFYGDKSSEIYKCQLIDNFDNGHLTAKSASSAVHHRRSQLDGSINSYRYQHVPDNQYSHQTVIQTTQKTVFDSSENARKLQAAYQLQNALSRKAADLFISCWQSLKALSLQANYLERQAHHYTTLDNLQDNELLKDFTNTKVEVVEQKHQANDNQFIQGIQSNESRKRQILQRQKQGITLDSLEKQRFNSRSKSMNKLRTKKDTKNDTIETQTKHLHLNQQQDLQAVKQRRQTQVFKVSGKSYREKYQEYQEKRRIQQQKQNETQLRSFRQQFGNINYLNGNHYYSGEDQRWGSRDEPKENVGTNQGQYDYSRYLLTYQFNPQEHYNRLFSYKSPLVSKVYTPNPNNRSQQEQNWQKTWINELNCIPEQESLSNLQQHEIIRAELIHQITCKLNYSKLKLYMGSKTNSQPLLKMANKIAKLNKAVADIKTSYRRPTQILKETQSDLNNKLRQEQILKQILQQISSIKEQINQLKLQAQPETKHRESAPLIGKQQQPFEDYHPHIYQHSPINSNQQTQHTVQNHLINININTQSQLRTYTQLSPSKSRKTLYKKVLFDGKHQGYEWEQRQIRQRQIRKMTQKVKQIRKSQTTSAPYTSTQERSLRPIRQLYEQNQEKLQKQRETMRQDDYKCCVLFNP